MDRLFKKIAKVTCWRDSVPTDATSYTVKQLTPGQQLEITDLRIKFHVDRSLTRTPNQCDVWISNLAQATRADLTTKPLSVQLDAGYDDVARLLFVGDLRFGMSKQEGPSWTTLLQSGDGARTYANSRVNRSYRSGTTVRTVLKNAAASMGLALPKSLDSDTTLDRQFVGGTISNGPARDELTRLLAPFGYHWSIQNGALRVLKDDEVFSTVAIPVDEDHGMIGTPEFGSPPRSGKPPHVHVKMLLYPEVLPGDVVKVTSKAISGSGLFRVERVRHRGDTHAKDWYTELEILPY